MAESKYQYVTSKRPLHRVIAERALGKPLPLRAVVHHVDENKANNANSNLVICEDRPYHILLHVRQRAYDGCGNAGFRRCVRCRGWDDPGLLNRVHRSQFRHAGSCPPRPPRVKKEKEPPKKRVSVSWLFWRGYRPKVGDSAYGNRFTLRRSVPE